MRIFTIISASVIFVAVANPSYAQDRKSSPYLACAADEALRAKDTSQSIDEVQSAAANKCASLLEVNVDNSIEAIMRNSLASGKPLPPQARHDLRGIIRPKLQAAFMRLIENNLTVLRQSKQ